MKKMIMVLIFILAFSMSLSAYNKREKCNLYEYCKINSKYFVNKGKTIKSDYGHITYNRIKKHKKYKHHKIYKKHHHKNYKSHLSNQKKHSKKYYASRYKKPKNVKYVDNKNKKNNNSSIQAIIFQDVTTHNNGIISFTDKNELNKAFYNPDVNVATREIGNDINGYNQKFGSKKDSVVLPYGGTIRANSIKGTLQTSAGIASAGSLQNSYITKNAIAVVNGNVSIASSSAMFGANLTNSVKQEKGYISKDIVMKRINFNSLITNKKTASILEDNYVVGTSNANTIAFYNALASYNNVNELNAALDSLQNIQTKQRYYSTFSTISYDLLEHNVNILKDNVITKTNKKGYSAIAGANYGAYSSNDNIDKNIQGYNTSSYNAYFGFAKQTDVSTNVGLLGTYSSASTTYTDNLGSRDDSLYQLSSFVHYSKNNSFITGILYVGMDKISTSRNDAKIGQTPEVAVETKFTANTSNVFFGTSLEYKKKYFLGSSAYIRPLTGLDAAIVLQDTIKESGTTVGNLGALTMGENTTYSFKPALGVELDKNLFGNTLSLYARAKVTYELGNIDKEVSAKSDNPVGNINLDSTYSDNSYEGDFALGAKYSVIKNLLFQAKAQFNIGDKQANANGGVSLTYLF